MMPIGPILLVILTILAASGFLAGSLRRLGLSERAGLLLLGSMLVGSLVEVPLRPGLSMNLGTGLLPLALALWLLLRSRAWWEPVTGVAAALLGTGAAILLSRWLPAGEPTELNLFYLDAQYFYALVAGTAGYLVGQSRRAAGAGAVLAVVGGDLMHYLHYVESGRVADLTIRLGGGGFHGTPIVAAVLALTLTEWLLPETAQAERGEAGLDHLPQP